MARFHGKVGFVLYTDDQTTGIVDDRVVEKTYFGKVDEHARRWQPSDMTTDDLRLDNRITITADDFAYKHASSVVYCEYMNDLWSVTGINVKRPKITLTLGGVYNGPRPAEPAGNSASDGA